MWAALYFVLEVLCYVPILRKVLVSIGSPQIVEKLVLKDYAGCLQVKCNHFWTGICYVYIVYQLELTLAYN